MAALGLLGIYSSAKVASSPVVIVGGLPLVTGFAFVTVGRLPWV